MPQIGDSIYIKKKYREFEANRQNNEGESEGGNLPAKAKVIGYLVKFQPSDVKNDTLRYFMNFELNLRAKDNIHYALVYPGPAIAPNQIYPASYKIIDPPKTMANQLAQRGGKKTRRRARGRKGTRKAN